MPPFPPVSLDEKVRVRRAIDAGNLGTDTMRNDKGNVRRGKTGQGTTHPVDAPPVYTAGQRATMRRGLRLLARIIARAHLRRQAARTNAAAPGPPTEREPGGKQTSEPASQLAVGPCVKVSCGLQ